MKILTCVAIVFVSAQLSLAQSLTIHKVDHTSMSFDLSQIDSITFASTVPLVAIHAPVLTLQFNDFMYNHNEHMTSDGIYIYTVNGGDDAHGRIKRYTWGGGFVDSVNIPLDFRSIMYNSRDGYLYASTYMGNLYKITNYAAGTYQLLFTALFTNIQASPALSADGNYVYGFNAGTLKKFNLATGALVETLTGFQCGSGNFGGDGAVAVDADYIYTINVTTHTVYVYTLAGSLVTTLTLPNGDFGTSFSCAMGYLFIARDGNYSTGTWYGYNVRRPLPTLSTTMESIQPEPERTPIIIRSAEDTNHP
jgi:hypothetical protein